MLLYHFFYLQVYVHIRHANFDYLKIAESYLLDNTSIEWLIFFQSKFSTPYSTIQCYLESPASIIACVFFYSLHFSFQNF